MSKGSQVQVHLTKKNVRKVGCVGRMFGKNHLVMINTDHLFKKHDQRRKRIVKVQDIDLHSRDKISEVLDTSKELPSPSGAAVSHL